MSDQPQKVSLCCIWGNYENEDINESTEVSVRKGTLTIVKRRRNEVKVNRVSMSPYSRTVSEGECIEMSDIIEEEVYKKYTSRGGPGENQIEVEEFTIEKPWLRPAHGDKLIGVLTYQFINQEGIEKMQVIITRSR